MLDTIQCSVYTSISLKGGKWIPHNLGLDNKFEWYWERIYNGITFHYYPYRYTNKRRTPLLWMTFSASTMQNGINVIGYNFGKSHLAVKEIEGTIASVVGKPISLKDITCISRIDMNRDFLCKEEVEKQHIFNFFKKIKGRSGMKCEIYDTGIIIGNSDVKLKFYFKDKDINLGDEMCLYMPKMARTEFQIREYRINKYYPENLNLYTLLTNKRMTEMVWDALLEEFRISGEICNKQSLLQKAKKIFRKTKKIRARKFRQLKQINDINDKVKHRPKTIEQSKDVINELDKAGICPYSCETSIVLKIDLAPKATKKKTLYYIIVPSLPKQPIRLLGYLDSS